MASAPPLFVVENPHHRLATVLAAHPGLLIHRRAPLRLFRLRKVWIFTNGISSDVLLIFVPWGRHKAFGGVSVMPSHYNVTSLAKLNGIFETDFHVANICTPRLVLLVEVT